MRPLSLWWVVCCCACEGLISSGRPPNSPAGSDAPGLTQPLEPRVRLLSAKEYRNTVRDLLRVEVAASHGDWGAGFETGADARLDENLFVSLLSTAQAAATRYAQGALSADFSCVTDGAAGCAERFVDTLGPRAFRRPLSAAQREAMLQRWREAEPLGAVRAAEAVVASLLMSPYFLYRTEVATQADPFERASLVSYALTASMPDAELYADASNGALDAERVSAHAQRLLGTPAGRERMTEFVMQWLELTALDEMAAAPADFPKLSGPKLGAALREELARFVSAVVIDARGDLGALLTDTRGFVNRHTAPAYGRTAPGDGFEQVQLDPRLRRGVLTLASTMAALSTVGDAERDRPVMRGLVVRRRLLCGTVQLPAGLDTAAAAQAAALATPDFETLTTREQFEAMMQAGENCRECHRQFMPLGFAFGHYGALGQYVNAYRGRPIDARVVGATVGEGAQTFDGALELIDALAQSTAASRCFTQSYLAYVLGSANAPHVRELAERLDAQAGPGTPLVARISRALAAEELYVRAEP